MTQADSDPRLDREPEYLLGTGDTELERLEFQHGVWRDTCVAALDRAGLAPGHDALDLGCGPGFAAQDIAQVVGETGSLTLLDESPRWHRVLADKSFAAPAKRLETTIEDASLEPSAHDLVYSRWVLSFLPDLDLVCRKVFRTLRPGGRLVVQDYNHDGIAVFPRSPGFEAAVRATRAFYRGAGGDPWVATVLPAALRRAGFVDVQLHANVKAGGPESGVFRWADVFFPAFSSTYVEKGLMTADERAQFLTEWQERKGDPESLFFSPMIVDVIATRPAAD